MTGLDVEAMLRDHEIEVERRAYPAYLCSCGGWDGAKGDDGSSSDGQNDNADAHRAHVAAVLRVEIAEWLSSDATYDAIWRAIDPNGYGFAAGDAPSVEEVLSALVTTLAKTVET